MKSRILRTVLALVAPLVIEYIIKKITGPKEVKNSNNEIPSPH